MNVLFDHARHARIGLPEAVLCQGKDPETISRIIREHALGSPILYTRLAPEAHAQLAPEAAAGLDYHPVSRTAWTGTMPAVPRGRVEYKGRWLDEMDLDAILARRPQLALVDELAAGLAESPDAPQAAAVRKVLAATSALAQAVRHARRQAPVQA